MHFFAELDFLPVQQNNQKYGPDGSQPTNLFNITSLFTLTSEVKAFACQSGKLVIQQSSLNPALVNAIIKPFDNLSIDFQSVNYYIYRGLEKNSFFNDALEIIDDPTTNTELRTRIKNARTIDDAYTANTIGFDSNFLVGTNNIESLFDNVANGNVRPINVIEGEWFGNFGSGEVGFEIILEHDKINVSIDFVRNGKTTVDIGTLTGLPLRSKREEILAYVDPAAFFALHFDVGINISTFNGSVKNTTLLKKNDINSILNKFNTNNRVYLDIRSEKGYSYNFYQNYSDGSNNNIKIPNPQPYLTNEWPIIFFDESAFKNIVFNLRLDDNNSPVLYSQNMAIKVTDPTSNFLLLKDNGGGWTNNIQFTFPNKIVFSCHLKIYYFRNRFSATPPVTTLTNKKYYDSAFCPVDLPGIGDITENYSVKFNPNVDFIREPLQQNGTGNFSYASHNGAYWDNNRIIFYCKLVNQLVSSEKKFLPTYTQNVEIGKSTFDRQLDIICRNYTKVAGGSSQPIKIIGVNNYSISHKSSEIINDKEILLLIGFTIEEIEAIKNTLGLSNFHHKYIYLQQTDGNPLTDQGLANGNKFYEYRVLLQGLDDNGNTLFVTPNKPNTSPATPILVYTRDQLFFHTPEFSAQETVTPGDNKVEFSIYSDGAIKLNDNIELGLIYDSQRIYFKYLNADNVSTEICNLQVVKANKMMRLKNGNNGIIPTPDITNVYKKLLKVYPSGDAERSYEDETTGNIVTKKKNSTIWAQYINLKKTIFMVYMDTSAFGNNTLGINFSFSTTNRLFANPALAAAVFGALVDLSEPVVSTGFSFFDGTCFPSAEHVNGEAMDTPYLNSGSATADDVKFATALNKFGFNSFRVGLHKTSLLYALRAVPSLKNKITPDTENLPHLDKSLHDSHLHSTAVVLINIDKSL